MTACTTLDDFAKAIRLLALELCYKSSSSHLGGCLSVADILSVLYGDILNISMEQIQDPKRDRLYYSKGHACAALYAALALRGFFSKDRLLREFAQDGYNFTTHVNHMLPGVELSTGSLGHALGVACGAALAGKRNKGQYGIFTLLSDGELNEGSNWEAILFAAHHHLDNLIAIVDYNGIQSFGRTHEVIDLEPLRDKFTAFGWETQEVDGHAIAHLQSTMEALRYSGSGKPKCLIAHTVKGKGVSFMEDCLAWHYRSPNDAEYHRARAQLERQDA